MPEINAKYLDLLNTAKEASKRAHAPYSKFPVGAALLTSDGKVFSGCNVENASFGATICAEQTAIVKAVSEGSRKFVAVAVYCAETDDCWPCGICRQVLNEFAPEIDVIVDSGKGSVTVIRLPELLTRSFGPKDLPG